MVNNTLEPININGLDFIKDFMGRCLTHISGDPTEACYLFQRLAITIHRFKVVVYSKNKQLL